MSCVLTLAATLALAQGASPTGQKPVPLGMQPSPLHPGDPQLQPPPAGPDQLPPDAIVLEVHGLCAAPANGFPTKSDSCTLKMTKEQFNAMLAGIGINSPVNSVPAMRSFAESYVQLMALAAAGEKAGMDKDPRFLELMKVVRVRAMADTYRHFVEEKLSVPSTEDITAYYNQNKANYEQLRLDRIFIPKTNIKLPPTAQVEYNKKAFRIAQEIRERAVNGEDIGKLQVEAATTLNLPPPPTTDIGAKRRGVLAPAIEKDVFALKGGEVTKLEVDPSGYSIYKLRSRDTMPLEAARDEIAKELHRKNVETAMKAAMDSVHTDLNDQFFKPHAAEITAPRGLKPLILPTPTPAPGTGTPSATPTPAPPVSAPK